MSMASSLQVKLLGAPSITLDGVLLSGFISSKAPALVYYLASTGQTQAREVLATLLWTTSPDFYAAKSLRNVLSNLRERLGPFLEITRTAVTLRVDQFVRVDSQQFLAKVRSAEKLPSTAAGCYQLLAEAVTLYSGTFLDGFEVADASNFEEWVRSEREHHTLLALQVLHKLVSYSAEQGQLFQALEYATRLLALDPLNEAAHRQLILLLALNGQTDAALNQYRTCQRLLQVELGVEPSTETRQLYARLQAGEFRTPSALIELATSGSLPPPSSPSSTASLPIRHNLPAEVTTFVGRDREVAQTRQRLADPTCRLLTLIGMGGMGKTRLALHVAHTFVNRAEDQQPVALTAEPFSDGIYFITLSALEINPQLESVLATTVATALNLTLSGATPPVTQLTQALYDKKILLVLDNFEHLLAAAPFVNTLLQGTQQLKVLVTSRARLHVRGEAVLQLVGLALPAALRLNEPAGFDPASLQNYSAIQLFAQRAQVVADFPLDETTLPGVVRICQLLQGMPLALELAATWTRLLTCTEIIAEIETNLDFLEGALSDLPIQQRSLRAVFDHSWRLLSPPEQQTLRRLAVFRGGFTRSAAATVADATLPLLAALGDKSLLRRSDQLPPPGEVGADSVAIRYELVELVRQYAAEQLVAAGENELLYARHAAWVAEFLASRQADLESTRQQEALRAIYAEIENIRAAWQWLLHHLDSTPNDLAPIETQIAQGFAALFHFYDMRSWFQEGEEIFKQLANRLPTRPTQPPPDPRVAPALWRLQANAQARQGWFAFHLGRYTESRRLLAESLRQLRALEAERDTIFNLNYLGAVLRHDGEYAAAQAHLQEALTLAQTYNDPLHASIALNTLGQLASLQGQWETARTLLHQALTIKRQIGDRWGLTYSLTYLGRVAQATGDHAAAQKLFYESQLICQEIGDQRGAAFALRNLGDSAQATGAIAAAQAHYQAGLQIYQEIGNRAEASLTLTRLGELACTIGNYPAAEQHLQAALTLAWAVQSTPGLLAALLGLASLALATGQPEQATSPLQIIYQHPASTQLQKEQAAHLLATYALGHAPLDVKFDLLSYVKTHLLSN